MITALSSIDQARVDFYASSLAVRGVDETEARIAARLVFDALDKGYSVTVQDGGTTVISRSREAGHILAAMFSTDEDVLDFWDGCGQYRGWVQLVWGNSHDLIADSSTNHEALTILAGAEALAEELADAA